MIHKRIIPTVLILIYALVFSHYSFAQYKDADFASWNWVRAEGTFEDPKQLEDLEK